VETDARGDPSRVRVDDLGRAGNKDCFIHGQSRVMRRSVSPFVSNSIESVAQVEHGGFKFESAQYQWRELVVKKKCDFLGKFT
jgi:hypothetical protein